MEVGKNDAGGYILVSRPGYRGRVREEQIWARNPNDPDGEKIPGVKYSIQR